MPRARLLIAVVVLLSLMGFAEQKAGVQSTKLGLMPVPAALQLHSGRLKVDSSFAIAMQGHSDPRLERAIARLWRRLEIRTGIQFARRMAVNQQPATLLIQCQHAAKPFPAVGEDESYTLEVTPVTATLKADSVLGVLRGLETFIQLVDRDHDGFLVPSLSIEDKPRFVWRGLLIDVSRHYQPIEVLKRNLDAMAAVKMSVFHWHLTDDQGFRVESRIFPKLHQMGSDGLFYSQEQIREIVEYAADRGIRVVPEFDMPGHTSSWFVGHPELASGPGSYAIQREFGIFDPVMDPTREGTYKFLDRFVGEMAALFPDAYMHIGGDENNGKQWNQNPDIQEFMKTRQIKDTAALQAYFNQRLLKILQKHGKKMVGWDEILHPDLPRDTVVQSWRGQQFLPEGAKQGFNGILSAPYYLDHFETAESHYRADPVPAGTDLSPEQAARILGGEACMWAEYISPDNIDSRIWPRSAAIAERFWSPASVTDVEDMYRRLAAVSRTLEELGLRHESQRELVLRRVAGAQTLKPLAILANAVEPVGNDVRFDTHTDTQLTALNRLADVVSPESTLTREFALLVTQLLSDAPRFELGRAELSQLLTDWQSVSSIANSTGSESPFLRDVQPRARELSQMGTAGLEAIAHLTSGKSAPEEWKTAQLALLQEAAKPKALLRFPGLPSFKILVTAASQRDRLSTMAPEQWRQAVVGSASQGR